MKRTDIDQDWLNAMAFAALHYHALEEIRLADEILDRVHEGGHRLDHHHGEVFADFAEAVARLLRDAGLQQQTALEFRNLDTNEVVDPAMFETTESGSASVWAARVCSAALSGDTGIVQDLIEARRTSPWAMLAAVQPLLIGASKLLQEADRLRDQTLMHVVMTSGGTPPTFTALCYAGEPEGIPVGWPQGAYCLRGDYGDRGLRDHLAAEHIRRTGHAVTLEES